MEKVPKHNRIPGFLVRLLCPPLPSVRELSPLNIQSISALCRVTGFTSFCVRILRGFLGSHTKWEKLYSSVPNKHSILQLQKNPRILQITTLPKPCM